MTCALCDLVRHPRGLRSGEHPVYEDEVAMVLVDSAPARREQALVIPKAHYRVLSELDERTGMHLVKLGMRAAKSLGMSQGGDVQVLLEGDAEGEEGEETHVHVRVCRTLPQKPR